MNGKQEELHVNELLLSDVEKILSNIRTLEGDQISVKNAVNELFRFDDIDVDSLGPDDDYEEPWKIDLDYNNVAEWCQDGSKTLVRTEDGSRITFVWAKDLINLAPELANKRVAHYLVVIETGKRLVTYSHSGACQIDNYYKN